MNKKIFFDTEQETDSLDINGLDGAEKNKGKSQEGLRPGLTRVTFILKDEHLEKIKQLSNANQRTILEIMDEALESYLSTRTNMKIPTKKKIK